MLSGALSSVRLAEFGTRFGTRFALERPFEGSGIVGPRPVVEVSLRRGVVLVAHVGLDRVRIEARDGG